jgi:3-oxoacyl-[acyl-carrier protein] reductase
MAERPLHDKVALVTGAASPIGTGRAMAIALVRAGARVSLLDVRGDWLEERLREVESIGGAKSATAVVADVSDAGAAERAVAKTIDDLGGLHIVVNNAGTTPRAGGYTAESRNFWELPVAAWNHVVSVNLNGAFFVARAATARFVAQAFGRIIGVTTSLDTMYRPRTSPYGPSKAGHEALVAMMARELEGTGVTANVLVPGGRTNTNFFAASSNVDRSTLLAPEIMEAPAVWLASDESRQCSGRRIVASLWDESLPVAERLAKASAPAAWPQLGNQGIAAAR